MTDGLTFTGHVKGAGKEAINGFKAGWTHTNEAIKSKGFWKAIGEGGKHVWSKYPLGVVVGGTALTIGAAHVACTSFKGPREQDLAAQREMAASQRLGR